MPTRQHQPTDDVRAADRVCGLRGGD